MKTLYISLLLVLSANAADTKHVFWYKATSPTAPYNMEDSTGPNLQGVTDVHGGKALTATIRGSAGDQDPLITLGNGLDNAQARSFVLWYKDLCDMQLTVGAVLKSAKFRGEYRDNIFGNPPCNAGPIRPRVGVVNIQGHFDAIGVTPLNHPDNAVWEDPINPLSSSMGYDTSGQSFKSEEVKFLTIPSGYNGTTYKTYERMFFEIDFTQQVGYILSNSGHLGIAAVVTAGDGSTGKINLYALEDGVIVGTTSNPWTKDGNTTHLVLEIENGSLEYKPGAASEKQIKDWHDISLSASPNPFNRLTEISYNCGTFQTGIIKIINSCGQTLLRKDIHHSGIMKFEGNNNPNGIYFCSLEIGGKKLNRKLFLTK
ncbi:MAG: hypothetical protein JNL74_02630 [Fibrobacteres bacterium]|nr:hypothetical protein [Fibrobacterota bacterium]